MSSMLKEGSKHFSGVEEATLKNIDACKQLAATVRTSLGPNGPLRTSHGARARGPGVGRSGTAPAARCTAARAPFPPAPFGHARLTRASPASHRRAPSDRGAAQA